MLWVALGASAIRVVVWLIYEWSESLYEPVDWRAELQELAVMGGVDLITIPIVVWLLLWVVRVTVAPLQRIVSVAKSMRAGHLDQRIEPGAMSSRELSEIANELNGAFDRQEDARRRVELFAGNASHQLRTPLASMQATAEAALLAENASSESREAFGAILQESRRLSRLLEQLLLMARLERRESMFIPVDLSAVIDRVAADFQPWLLQAGIGLELERPGEAPIRGQPELLYELLANLLDNAGKSCPPGARVRINLAGSAREGWHLMVEDSGPGIPAEGRERLFSAFSRGERQYHGAGLGLAICREIARLHGGEIALVDGPLGGAAFSVTLPADGRG
jgi:signal transduction histidine kinase